VDLDRDGAVDLLTGSFQPGDVLLFRGRKAEDGGGFEPPHALVDRHGEVLRVGRASWPQAVDWDRDGDLDLVLGNMYGALFLARNRSSGAKLELEPPVELTVAGQPVKFDETNAAPLLADWDQDGALDLLLGLSSGRVLFFRNTTTSGESVLAAPRELVAPAPPGVTGTLPRSGLRARVAVVDWNQDGRSDLLVGEYAPRDGEARELDEGEREQLAAAMRASLSVAEERGRLESDELLKWLRVRGLSIDDGPAHYENFLLDFKGLPATRALDDRLLELAATQRRLSATNIDRGYVWVYLRAPKDSQPAEPPR